MLFKVVAGRVQEKTFAQLLNIDLGVGEGGGRQQKGDPKNLKLSIVEGGWQEIMIFIYTPYQSKQ